MGLLLVVLFFYHQTTRLRTQLLQETERLSAIRLLLDRLTTDLRCARTDFSLGMGLTGDATSLDFVSTGVPSLIAWQGASPGRAVRAETDLRRISYRATTGLVDTNVVITGFTREEQPLVEQRQTEDILADDLGGFFLEDEPLPAEEPLTDTIHFVRFRYWDGSAWQDSWDSTDLPTGVEVNFGGEPLPEDLTADEYPYELFRRVIYLPGSTANIGDAWLDELMDEIMSYDDSAPTDETAPAEATTPAEGTP